MTTPIEMVAESERLRQIAQKESVMIRVAGEEFRCPCGANVFRYPGGDKTRLVCNGCGYTYLEGRDFER